MRQWRVFVAGLFLGVLLSSPVVLQAQRDPGPRGGPAGAGGFIPNLDPNAQALFNESIHDFMEVDSVSGSIPGEEGSGLGPTFNGNGCALCHAQPAMGGSSPGLASKQNSIANPQVGLATLDGATNTVPSFVTVNGPVREARFVRNSDGSPDGGVHALYTITGRTDANGCTLAQPNFAAQLAAHNVIFRIPTPTFGLGLVEATPDASLQANLAANSAAKSKLGISGRFNTSGNDGTITRFGWKAQNKSLMVFAGEAYNVEQGVSNEAFTNERSATPGCVYNGSPEDATRLLDESGSATGTAVAMSSDVVNFAVFMRFLSPPAAAPFSASAQNGSKIFNSVGCALCHSPSLTTGPSKFTGMSNVAYQPYSDFALHQMGPDLADGISQGAAAGDEFRTAPLWGLGQRLFFLHDGRTSDLMQAIEAHASSTSCTSSQTAGSRWKHTSSTASSTQNCASEANGVVRNYHSLSRSQVQDLLNFLRSL